mgnify:CR=1 FL=1
MENNSNLNNIKKQSPWTWIPTLYFLQGIPYVVVATTLSVIMFKRLGVSNTDIGLYTSLLYLPWLLKPLWSPFVDILKTRRWWILSMQLIIGVGLLAIGFLIPGSFFFKTTLTVFWIIGFSSATHDIAADGFYMLALDSNQQSFFVGIRSTFYRLAMITGQGLIVMLAGYFEVSTGLEPLNLNVNSTHNLTTQIDSIKLEKKVSNNDRVFVAFPSKLTIPITKITIDSLQKMKDFVANQNLKNGFVAFEKTRIKKDNWWKRNIVTWWNEHLADPTAKFIKRNFGEKKEFVTKNGLVGNVGLVKVQLNKIPKEGKKYILNTTMSGGDKSIHLIGGERLTFNEKNWNKPAYMLVQLDSKLDSDVTTTFKSSSGDIPLAWSIAFYVLSVFFLIIYVYNRFVLPKPISDIPKNDLSVKDILKEFGGTFEGFFNKPGIGIAIAFLLLYRLGEAFLLKMANPFLLDSRDIGGLGLTTSEVGLVYGSVGVLSLTLGGIIGGIVASRKGLKFWIWIMAFTITLPHLAYLYLAWFQPTSMILINISVALEQFGYGFGFTAYMLYMIYFSEGEHKTAHYAICTGFMAASMMIPGMIAGWLQELIGYNHFFIFVMLCSIPTLLIVPFLKIDKDFGRKTKAIE